MRGARVRFSCALPRRAARSNATPLLAVFSPSPATSLAPVSAGSLTVGAWVAAILAAFCIGLAKSGFSGIGLLSVALMAGIVPARQSTGLVLPLLIFADFLAAGSFREHADWGQVWRLLLPALAGVIVGTLLMRAFADPVLYPDRIFRRVIGGIVLTLVALQTARRWWPGWFTRLHVTGPAFAVVMGLTTGVTTMLANAAGPVATIYLLAIGLAKYEIVGTGAWIFLILNLVKVPFTYSLGLINTGSLTLNVCLAPTVAAGVWLGRTLLGLVSQQIYDWMLLVFATAAAMRLLAA